MKKILVAVSAFAIAIASNAASCNWSLTNMTNSPDATAAAGKMIAYYMDATTYSAFTALASDAVADYVTANALGSGTAAAGGRGQGIIISGTSGTYTYSAAGTYASAYLVVFDAATIADAKNYAYTSVKTSATAVPESGSNLSLEFGTFASAQASTWTAVPEPTSGLLLLLGMAGLALRRRLA